jgi:polysaccharide deacetylase family protein (PEP-CTERM system associated)
MKGMFTAGTASAAIVNAMTIDVEDYFHVSAFEGVVSRYEWDGFDSRVCRNTERLLGIFQEAGTTATFFVLGWVAERFPALVRKIAAAGHEIACHSYAHRLVYDLTQKGFRDDLRRAKDAIESASGQPVYGYRAPSYSITPRSLWALDILIEEGFLYDASIFPIHHDRYGIPLSGRHAYSLRRSGGSLLEVPASTIRCGPLNLPVAGGGYFRLLPYAWTKWGIARLNRAERRPAVFYLHPWELDAEQPRLPCRTLSRVRHYGNLARTEARLRRLLRDFQFGPVQAVLGAVEAGSPALCPEALPYLW